MFRPCLILAFLALASGSASEAGEIGDAATAAERLVGEGKHREAWDALAKASDAIWRQSPLEFRRIVFVASEPQGYGVYDLRETNQYKAGDSILVYGEPFGFGYGYDGEIAKIEFEVRLSVAAAQGGQVVIPARSGRLSLRSRHENKEFMLYFSYEPQGLKAGDYVLVAEFRDVSSGKTATARLPFRMQ